MPGDAALATIEVAERWSEGYGPDRARRGAELRARADEVVALLTELIDSDPSLAVRLAAALPALWEDIGRVDEGRRLTEMAIERADDGPGSAAAQLAVAELAFRQGEQGVAAHRAEIAIERATSGGIPRVAALGHVVLARVAYRDGDAPRIDAHARRCLAIAPDDPASRRSALHMLAWAAYTAGDHALASERFEESLALRQRQGDRFGVAVEIANLGDLAAEDGDVPTAATHLGEALEVAAELDSRYLILNLLPSIAVIAAQTGADEAAARLIGAADGVGEQSGLVPDPGAWQPPLDKVAGRLGPRFEVLRAEGRALDVASAVSLARSVSASLRGERD